MSRVRNVVGAIFASSAALLVASVARAQGPVSAPTESPEVAQTDEGSTSDSSTSAEGSSAASTDAVVPETSNAFETPAEATSTEESQEFTSELAELSLEELLQIQVVESASRRAQSMHNAPSSVSLLRYDDIEAMRGLNAAHPFRRLLGVHVMRYSTNVFRVHVRDMLGSTTNRVQLLVDGRNAIEPIIGYSPFIWLAYATEDMASAEVIRGPGSVLYGANATGGVVSIRSRRPIDHPGFEGRLRTGVNYIGDDEDVPGDTYRLDTVGLGHAAYNYANDARTFGLRLSVGTQTVPEAVPTIAGAPRHGQVGYHALAGVEYRPTEGASLYATASQSYTETYDPIAGDAASTTSAFTEQAFTVNYDHEDLVEDLLTVRATFDTTRLYIRAGSGVSQESLLYHGVVQGDLSVWDDRNVTTVGIEVSRQHSDTQGLSPGATNFSLMGQDELKLVDERLILNAAARWDHITYHDGRGNEIIYRNVNPRGSVIWRIVEDHDVRVTAATAFRTPLPLESSIGAFYPPNAPGEPPIPILAPNPALAPTKAQMIELGYRGDLVDRVRVEGVLSFTRVVDDVRIRPTPSLPFVFQNAGDLDVITGEVGVTTAISARAEVFANYVGTRVHPRRAGDMPYPHVQHHLTLGGNARFGDDYYAQGDFDIATGLSTVGPTTVSGLVGFATTSAPRSYDLNVRFGRYLLDGRVDVFVEGWNLLGLAMSQGDLNRFTGAGFSTPIPATLLVGIGLRGI